MPVSSNIFSLNGITPSTNNLIGDLRIAFEHSYFNILLNNVYGARKSSYYFDVDYNTSQFLPVNFNYIISRSAAIASVQDSNYTTKRVISSRYEGSKTISDSYQLEGTSSYGPQYTIDWTTPYFAVFEEVTDAFPKGGGGSKLTISKLVYKDGTTIPLDDRGNNYFDVTTIFTPDDNVSLYYTEIPSGTFISNNTTNKTVDESGHLYTTIASYKPTAISPSGLSNNQLNPYVNQDDNVTYYSFLDVSSSYDIYREQVAYGYNNLLAQKSGENAFYMYFNFPNSASAGTDPFNSTGYFLGMGLILRNFYPNTGEQYPSYRTYPWIRFEHFNTSSVAGQNYPPYVSNYNFYVNTELLPVKEGDYIRLYNATEAPVDAYSNDANIFFLSNASGSFIKDSIYDSIIDRIDYTLATSLNFLTISGSANLSSENFFISNTSASIYRTSNRFGDLSPAALNDPAEVVLCTISNENSIDISPKNLSNPTLGDNIIFKKLYTFNKFNYTSNNLNIGLAPQLNPTRKYKYWALGNSGSLYRAEGSDGQDPFVFTKVTNNNIDILFNGNPVDTFDINSISCSLNAMASLNDSPFYDNPNLSSTQFVNPFPKNAYHYGLHAVVGDSGSVFISRNYGNTWSDISLDSTTFPNKDEIHFKDVFIGVTNISNNGSPNNAYYIIAVGTSGSVYMTRGKSPLGNINTNVISNNDYPFDFKNNWSSYYSYQYFIDLLDYETSYTAYQYPAGALRQNFTFNKIIPVQNFVNNGYPTNTLDTISGFILLANNGSMFFLPGYILSTGGDYYYDDRFTILNFKTGDSYPEDPSFVSGKLIAITGSYINSLIRGGSTYPSTLEFSDGIVSQSGERFDIGAWDWGAYNTGIAGTNRVTGSIKLLFLDKTGTVWKEPHFVSSSFSGVDNGSYGSSQAFKVFEELSSASLNEIKEFSSINYANNPLNNEPFIWIPSSQRTLLYYPSSLVWSSPTILPTFYDLDLNSGSFFTGSNSVYPTNSFYSITSVENVNTAYSPVWVKFTPRASFPFGFSQGRSSFPYAANPSYGPGSNIGMHNYTGTRQAFRFYRKYSNEQYVLTKEYTQNGKGFIIPGNYDPSLNYMEIL